MTYTELVESTADECLTPVKVAGFDILKMKVEQRALTSSILRTFFNKLHAHVLTGGEVKIQGFGKFTGRFRPERKMKIGSEEVTVKAKTLIKFKQY